MKIFKFLLIVSFLMLFNTVSTNSFADEWDEIKGNVVKKLFCKTTASINTGSSSSDSSTSTSVEATE